MAESKSHAVLLPRSIHTTLGSLDCFLRGMVAGGTAVPFVQDVRTVLDAPSIDGNVSAICDFLLRQDLTASSWFYIMRNILEQLELHHSKRCATIAALNDLLMTKPPESSDAS